MRILQIASHKTNIGDGANITGFQDIFREDAQKQGLNVTFINEEIMEYRPHLGNKDFNSESFIQLANSVDLVVIGGGGFFSAFERFKNTGCHVDFTISTLERIKTPIVYYAQGFAVYYGQKYHNTDRLAALFKYAQDHRDRILISLRNDGSKDRLKQLLPIDLVKDVDVIPDGGFFVPVNDYEHPELDPDRLNIGIQLAGDKATFRFKEKNSLMMRAIRKAMRGRWEIEDISRQQNSLKAIAQVAEKLVRQENANLVLLPHIHSDLSIIDRFTHILPRDIVRFNLNIAAVLRGHAGALRQFDLYRKLYFVMGMRFHSNVCAFAVNTPSLGLVSHDQLDGLYDSLGFDNYVYLSNPNLAADLLVKTNKIKTNYEELKDGYRKEIDTLRTVSRNFHRRMITMAST